MNFNTDPRKKAQGLVFLLNFQTKQKTKQIPPEFPTVNFDENTISQAPRQKVLLHTSLNFSEHNKAVIQSKNKTV